MPSISSRQPPRTTSPKRALAARQAHAPGRAGFEAGIQGAAHAHGGKDVVERIHEDSCGGGRMDKIVGFPGIHCPPAETETAASLFPDTETTGADHERQNRICRTRRPLRRRLERTRCRRARAAIASLWMPDGEHYVRTLQAKGYEALQQRVTGSHEKNVRDAGFRFISAGDAQFLHDAVMFHWHMVPAAGGAVAAVGLELPGAGRGRPHRHGLPVHPADARRLNPGDDLRGHCRRIACSQHSSPS